MKKFVAFLLAFAMVLSLTACGGTAEEDPNAGKYHGVSATVMGFTLPMSEVYENETWVELKSGGKGTIMLDGDDFSMKWTLEGETFTLTVEGEDSVGTLADGVITVDLMNMGCVMTFQKEGSGASTSAATYNDAGYWEMIRIDSEDADSAISEEDMAMASDMGMGMYLELLPDGTGNMYIDEDMPLTWHDGSITFVDDNLTISYGVENGELTLDMLGTVMAFRKGSKVTGASEMEAAGFTQFMEVGVGYPYTTGTGDDVSISTTGEATVTSYEIFDSAEGYSAEEGYEWRVVKMEIRFYDENTSQYGCKYSASMDDYYTSTLNTDTFEIVEETDSYDLYAYSVLADGQEMEAYCYYSSWWGDWYTGEAGNDEIIRYLQWDYLVPVGYDGSVAVLWDSRMEWPDGAYITDLDPANFLLFRAD